MDILGIWQKFLETKHKNDYISLFINIPFCLERCSYCIYYRNHYTSKNDIDSYLNYIEMEAKRFSSLFRGVNIEALYIGGGHQVY